MTPEERERILYTWNDTQADFQRDSLVHDLITAQAQANPDRTAVIFEGDSLTYAELDQASNQLAHHLRKMGVGVDSLAALFIHRSLNMVIGALGIIKAGGAFIPIDPDLPPARIRHILDDARPPAIVTQEELLPNLQSGSLALCLDRDWPLVAAQPTQAPNVAMSSENLVYVIYTSGSTGLPKGVQIVHRSLINQLDAKGKYLNFGPDEHLLATTTISFDPAIWELFLTLTRGARLSIAPRAAMLDGARIQRMIEEEDVTIMRGTPTNWRILLNSGWQGKADLKAVCGGEELTLDLARAIRSRTAFLSNGYGPTEITIAATVAIITPDTDQITIGRPHQNMQVYILDENQEPVPVGVIGEIYIAGEGVSPRGYLNQPHTTATRFMPNPFADGRSAVGPIIYKSGDLGSYLPDGRILFHGRNDSQVKIRGHRVELGDVEAAVRRHPAVSNNVTLALEVTPGDRQLISYLILRPGHKLPAARDLRTFLRHELPAYMLPSRFVLLDAFPVSPNGKIDRRAVAARLVSSEMAGVEDYIAPRSALEGRMAAIFARHLNLDHVSASASFFDLGGNSLLATRLLADIQEQFQSTLTLRDFLADPTVLGLGQFLETNKLLQRTEANTMVDEAGGPDPQMADPQPLTDAEREKIVYEWNATQHEYDREITLHELISARARQSPDNIAVIYEENSLTYAELEWRSNQLANHLVRLGVSLESLVGLYMQRSVEMVIAILGVLKAGGAYVPIDPDLPTARIQLMLDDAQTQILLTQEHLLENVASDHCEIVCLDRDWPTIAREASQAPSVAVRSHNLAYVIYTSGSTGKPKGAQNIHRSIVNLIGSMARRIGIDARDNVLSTTTLSFDPSVWEIFLPLTCGSRLTIASRAAMVDGQLLQHTIDSNGVTFLRSTPTGWRLYLESGWRGGANLKILSGGEKLSLDLARALQQKCAALWHTYGPAEAAVFCTLGIIPSDADEITIGRPHDNIQIYILNHKLRPVAVGEVGELHIGGDGVGRGYWNRPRLTAAKFISNPFHSSSNGDTSLMYRTGDLARFRHDGQIVFVGRSDTQVKISGRRIELGDVEAALQRHPAIKQNVTIAREVGPGDKRLISYLIPAPEQKMPGVQELRAFLQQTLPDYMLPSRYLVVDSFPVSPNGKLDHRALPDPDSWGEALSSVYAPPRSPLEKELADIVAAVLNLGRVGIDESFFDLGGSSLLAARLIYKTEKHFQVKVSIREFLAGPDVDQFARVIAAAQKRALEQAGPHHPPDKASAPILPLGENTPDLDLPQQSNLTQGQFLMWMGQQMNPVAPLYNVVHAFTIHGQLDSTAVKLAFQALVDHHDALRTIFYEVNGVPQQKVLPSVVAQVEMIDFSQEKDPDHSFATFLEQRQARLLPLDKPLFDAVLIKMTAERTIWYLCQHHILTDALSSELIFERLGHYYQLALEGHLDDIPRTAQYAQYVQYERDLRQSPVFKQALDYWQGKYGTPLPPTEFYGKTAVGSSTETVRVVHELGARRSEQLRAIAQQGGFASPSTDMSLFTVFATLLFATLHRLNGQRTLRMGTPFHGRPTLEALDMIGLFIEMGVVQVDIAREETFDSLGQKVLSEILDGLTHVQSGISTAEINSAYDVILNYIQATFHSFGDLPVTKELVHSRHIDTKHQLRLQITDYDGSGNFVLLFDLKASLFAESERGWFVQHFLRVVDAFIAARDQGLGDFALISNSERSGLLRDFNDTETPYPAQKTVVQLFEEQVRRTPSKVAVIDRERTISYQELNRRANRLAQLLSENGVGPETAVAICMERSIEVLIAIWGVLKAGGAYIPLDPSYPADRIAYMLADSGARLMIVNRTRDLSTLDMEAAPPLIELAALDLELNPQTNPFPVARPDNLVYLIYTSGSTGKPKGTMLTQRGLVNYVSWARQMYQNNGAADFALYSSLSFDLTVTSIFVPLLSGGKVVVYRESSAAPGMEILSVFEDDIVDIVKLTPAHLRLVRELDLSNSRIRTLIVGGEDFKTDLARAIHEQFKGEVTIYNEYGPTEAVVGCMIHRYDPLRDTGTSVPIGTPAANARIYLLDAYDQPVPPGVIGEIVISGDGVARGYHQRPLLTAERFGKDPFHPGARIYRTGDIARWNEQGQLLFLGRRDHQVKIGSARIELGEIESVIRAHDRIDDVVVKMVQFERHLEEDEISHCLICGLPSNYPDVTFDDAGICNLCTEFETFRDDVFQYFKTMDDLHEIVEQAKATRSGEYDCMMLYSGGKDSTYVLSQLVEMDLKVLAFSLDNGYISEDALDNVRRITEHLGVDLIIGSTPHMNAIFADSLERFSNVCQGCYKAIYTLSMNLARKKGIKFIFTGLSRGQLFETRLDELFRNRMFGVRQMDEAVLNARKIYHGVDDAVHQLLDVSMFHDDRVFEEIQLVDYFRYTEVELDELYEFLSTRVPWIRPRDTGRSTNCLINEAGIFVHQTERGYHNYALPYSWDVRLGHKTRAEAMEELDDEMRMPMVHEMLGEVGYSVKKWHSEQSEQRLAAYFIANNQGLTISELRDYLRRVLPAYMLPAYLVRLEKMPLTINGKIDRLALPNPTENRPEMDAAFAAPQTELEIGLAGIWSRTLNVDRVGIHDNFFDLGGASIPAVQVVAIMSDQYGVPFPVRSFFENPTVAEQSVILEGLLVAHLDALSDEEVERLLAEMEE